MYKVFDKIPTLKIKYESRYFSNVLVLLFILIFNYCSFSQSTLIDELDYNKDSRSLVFMLNSNGYATGFRFSKRIDGFRSRLIDIDLVWYKHPKEQRMSSLYANQSKFVYGKLNQLLILRTGYGKQKELFGKYAKNGIVISFYYTLGASLGMLKPVYFDVIKGFDFDNRVLFESEKFDKEEILNPGQIYSGGSFFKGFDELEPVFGGYIKLAFSFNINKTYKAINTLEIGTVFDFYHKQLPLMAYSENKQYIFTMFIAYRFGKKREQRINNQ